MWNEALPYLAFHSLHNIPRSVVKAFLSSLLYCICSFITCVVI